MKTEKAKLSQGIEFLAEQGLNLFATLPCEVLPDNIIPCQKLKPNYIFFRLNNIKFFYGSFKIGFENQIFVIKNEIE